MSDGIEKSGLMRRAWFKPMVGAWFALLLGGALWLMPPHIHALLARSTQLDALHPMFAPPVGSGGVAVMALVVGLFGFFLGIAVAGRVAAASAPRAFAPGFDMRDESGWEEPSAEDEIFEQPRRRRVFSAREDIGEEGIAISAPPEEERAHEAGEEDPEYEAEYSLEEIPVATPEEDFDAVYAELDGDYVPDEVDPVEVEMPEVEEAEFEPVEDYGAAPDSEVSDQAADTPIEPSETGEAMGDMSLEDLLGRLEGALEQHKKLVAGSEEAARQPAPQTVPLVREPEEPDEETAPEELGETAADDPVIAFLRREASRRMPATPPTEDHGYDEEGEADPPSQTEAQAALRSALERLGQVNRRD